ncbi:MAG TPA: GNAT family N-acetyltransferase [Calditrichaeota bacterium]|nr:GNAT family N-acetyltransferase [Calditrichota bacterium]
MKDIEVFSEDDLNDVFELCRQSMVYDTFTETLLREKIIEDPQHDPALILVIKEKGKVIAFMDGVTRKINGTHIGYIKLMAVDKQWRRQGIASELYSYLEKEFKRRKAQLVRIYDVPFNYFMPGIDPRYTAAISFAEKNGFRRFADTSNMVVDLTNQDFRTEKEEKALSKKNIVIRRAAYEDHDNIMKFIDTYFPLWRPEVENTFLSLPISLHIALLDDEIKAFSGHNGNNFGTGWFGPMGTHSDLRGKGIGGILLKRCLQDIKTWGLPKSIIPWVGPVSFYARTVGAVVERVFWRYEKKL